MGRTQPARFGSVRFGSDLAAAVTNGGKSGLLGAIVALRQDNSLAAPYDLSRDRKNVSHDQARHVELLSGSSVRDKALLFAGRPQLDSVVSCR